LELLAPILHLPALHVPPAIAYPLFFVLCPLSIMLFMHHRHLGMVAQDHKKLLSTIQILIGHIATPDDGMSPDDIIRGTLAALGETLGNNIFVVYLNHVQAQAELVSHSHYPESEQYFEGLRLDIRASAAGRACSRRAVVYVPCYRRRHGIRVEERLTDIARIETLCLEMDMTKADGKPPFDSLLCAPVFVGDDVAGCVCFGSRKRNAFGRFHFSAARTAAKLLGIYLVRKI
jgi:GAF domain-containing protein